MHSRGDPADHEPLMDIDQHPWHRVNDAYGPATEVPGQIRALLAPEPQVRAGAIAALWSSVWHQGTVYTCSPLAVPFLAEAANALGEDAAIRTQVLLLLASLAAATSFIPFDPPEPGPDEHPRPPPRPTVALRDLDIECRAAVAVVAPALASTALHAGLDVQAATLPLLAATTTAIAAEALISDLEAQADPRLAAAARLTRLLGEDPEGDLPAAVMAGREVDGVDREYLEGLGDEPVEVQGRALVLELVERYLA